ncbi:MAG: hypothetical protein JWO80_2476 [Bryobacterales bacterium]|nr:hypothetical protein [Bryobacterales bacterium]
MGLKPGFAGKRTQLGRAKDFVRVAELLQPIRLDLTDVESKRLAYAEKHAGTTAHVGGEEITKRR